MFTAINAITGVNEYQFGTAGSSVDHATVLERFLNAFVALLLGAWAFGIKKRKIHGWWLGTIAFSLGTLGLLSNVRFALGEEDKVFMMWIIVSQVGAAAISSIVWLKWWKPQKTKYFEANLNIEQDALRNPDKPVS